MEVLLRTTIKRLGPSDTNHVAMQLEAIAVYAQQEHETLEELAIRSGPTSETVSYSFRINDVTGYVEVPTTCHIPKEHSFLKDSPANQQTLVEAFKKTVPEIVRGLGRTYIPLPPNTPTTFGNSW